MLVCVKCSTKSTFRNSSECVCVAYAIESRKQPTTYSLTHFEFRIEQVLSSNDKCTCSMHTFPILTKNKKNKTKKKRRTLVRIQ